MVAAIRTIRDCNVCVIGGAGFLGSHLVDHLIEDRGCRVVVADNLITGYRKYVHPAAKFIWHDIRYNVADLVRLFHENKIQYVMNWAALAYIPDCFERPGRFFDINATSVLNVLDAAQAAKVDGVLQVSSAEIYGDMSGKIKESDPVSPHSTYGVSKLAADGLVQVRWREASVPAIAMRQFNCVGERETHPYVIPEIISQLHQRPWVQLGNNSTRDFQYAGDAVRMAVELLERGQFGEVYNMGSESAVKIYDLARMIGQAMGHDCIDVRPDPSRVRPWEIWHLQSDNEKLYGVIDRRPEITLDQALERTVRYFRENGNRWDWQ